jgi:hypothetical protein
VSNPRCTVLQTSHGACCSEQLHTLPEAKPTFSAQHLLHCTAAHVAPSPPERRYELLRHNRFRGIPLNLLRVVMRQCLTALAVLSHKEIVHCDLKPENIMLKSISSPQARPAPSAELPAPCRTPRRPGARGPCDVS